MANIPLGVCQCMQPYLENSCILTPQLRYAYLKSSLIVVFSNFQAIHHIHPPSQQDLSTMFGFEQYYKSSLLLVAILIYFTSKIIYTIVYNLFFHPLSHVPGPALAAATFLYQAYYSLIGPSRYYMEVGKMHEKYGISPPPFSLLPPHPP